MRAGPTCFFIQMQFIVDIIIAKNYLGVGISFIFYRLLESYILATMYFRRLFMFCFCSYLAIALV